MMRRTPRLIVYLKGGLGNQMFQYAAARSLGIRAGAELVLDTSSGFVRDKIFKRTFSLEPLLIEYREAGFFDRLPFWTERVLQKFSDSTLPIRKRPWGLFICEDGLLSIPPEIITGDLTGQTWMMDGYWQSESYFSEHADIIGRELAMPTPTEACFVEKAGTIQECNSVAVGVRLFEEVPGVSKNGVGGLTPLSFYEHAASILATRVKNPVFFVFCTDGKAIRNKLTLPGKIHYITHDNGFEGAIQRLWLISQCRHHILSNSSFYWWGAWLSEHGNHPKGIIIAADSFPNNYTIPARWLRLGYKREDSNQFQS